MPAKIHFSGRIVFDVSSVLRWTGAPVGMVRVVHELSRWARDNIADVVFVFFDPERQKYRELNRAFADDLLAGRASIDTFGLTDPARPGRRRTDAIPNSIKPAALWVIRFPHMLLRSLERIRLTSRNSTVASFIDRLQRPLMSAKRRSAMVANDGSRRAHIPLDLAFANELEFRRGDTLICTGSGWLDTNIRAIRDAKTRTGFRLILLNHDIIPLLFPQFYKPHDVEAFQDYFQIAFAISDLVIFTTRTGESDALSYCSGHAIKIGRTAVGVLGADPAPPANGDGSRLPAGLDRGKYLLFVSTIEPRKGHRLLYEAWLRLLADGVPQATGTKLVLVGRPGWMMEDFLQTLTTDPRTIGSVHVLQAVDNATLATLYQGAAFCLYPSIYEGYGLPVVEAFFYGKAVLSSNGGALAEVVGEFSPCLDPTDGDRWYRTMKAWIENPKLRAPYEQAIRSRFRHPTWTEAAERFFAIVAAPAVARQSDDRSSA
jgi:glycosyltransferase involved in cell wall biosynthesis